MARTLGVFRRGHRQPETACSLEFEFRNFGWLCLATPCEASGVDVNLMPQVDIRWYMRFEDRAAEMRTYQLEAISNLLDRFPAPAAR